MKKEEKYLENGKKIHSDNKDLKQASFKKTLMDISKPSKIIIPLP